MRPPRRALYRYVCAKCQKKRGTLVYSRAIRAICTKHVGQEVSENQPALFPAVDMHQLSTENPMDRPPGDV